MAQKIAADMAYNGNSKRSYIAHIMVMALSLVAVVILWATFGHIGPTFSSDVMTLQRAKLRHHFGLPPEPIITNLKILQIPPSERSLPPTVYYGSSK
ncbi:MAG TPA: hypothetical protein VEL11_02770 [Candidatus Bathyarchaeia archaeon]|nr:hypothetical protein [Candidatus Bathyarchaeia archaeon]